MDFLESIFSFFAGLFGLGGNGQDAGGGGNFFSNIFKSLFGGQSDPNAPPQPNQNSQPSTPKPNMWESIRQGASNMWNTVSKGATDIWHTVTGYFNQHPQELESKLEGNKIAMYVQAGKVIDGKGAVGNLVLTDDKGHTETFKFTSGPWENGALPGLLNTDGLAHANKNDPNKPVTSYTLGTTDHDKSDHRYCTTDGQTGFWMAINNPDLETRGGFGIHPNRKGASGEQVGTLGCIGLDDESARKFNAILDQLHIDGKDLKLDVFASGQDAEKIELAKLNGTTVAKANGKTQIHS